MKDLKLCLNLSFQVKMRQHSRMLVTQRALLALWSAKNDTAMKGGELIDLSRSICYVDRLRVRLPGNATNLRGHIDSGSINRWTDEQYRNLATVKVLYQPTNTESLLLQHNSLQKAQNTEIPFSGNAMTTFSVATGRPMNPSMCPIGGRAPWAAR